MKRKFKALIMSLMCIGLTACDIPPQSVNSEVSDTTNSAGYKNISPKEAKERLEKEKGIVLLDVRTQEEYDELHIPNSILIPVDIIENEAPLKLKDKNAVIFIYCRSGRRSVIASEALVKLGYSNVYNLGGIIDWTRETEK